MAADYGEGVQDVGSVLAGQAVEVEVECVETGSKVAALFGVPGKRRAVVAQVAGEGRHVVSGVGKAEHMVTDQTACRRLTEATVVVGGRYDGELLDNEPIQVLSLNFLSGDKVKCKGIEASG